MLQEHVVSLTHELPVPNQGLHTDHLQTSLPRPRQFPSRLCLLFCYTCFSYLDQERIWCSIEPWCNPVWLLNPWCVRQQCYISGNYVIELIRYVCHHSPHLPFARFHNQLWRESDLKIVIGDVSKVYRSSRGRQIERHVSTVYQVFCYPNQNTTSEKTKVCSRYVRKEQRVEKNK